MESDLEIARAVPLRPLPELAARYGIPAEALIPYGHTRAKLRIDAQPKTPRRERSRYVIVTAITPTPAGEGKTVHTIGLSLALNKIGQKAVCAIRQPSMGPVFGIKGGAAGGGMSQVVPMEDFNLHLTGDFHAVAAANNLLAAAIDTSLLLDNPHKIVPESVRWKRVVDVNDRALREIEVGLGGAQNGIPRRTGFEITPASEVMAILGLSKDLADLRARLARIVVGQRADGSDVTAGDLEVAGAMAALLGEAIHPTIMQTTEATLAFVHTGPFANIAHGNSSIIADQVASRFFDYIVTEGGFASDMGAEKFFDIKCRNSGLTPDCAVLVATVRALKVHSGRFQVVQGKPLPPELNQENLDALAEGCSNLVAHIENVRNFGVPVIVAVNRFGTDTDREIALVRERALEAGADAACISELFAKGGAGGRELAEAVHRAATSGKARFKPLYELSEPLTAKIERLATKVYGADGVDYSDAAKAEIARLEKGGQGKLPICVAKSQYSLSHDGSLKGRPRGYRFPVRGVRLSAGAGFVVVYAGDIMTMPGLGKNPGYKRVDLDDQGRVKGLF